MSTLSEEARAKAKSKVERLVRTDPQQRVDASDYRPDGPMDADVQTGPRPISRRQFRRGGTVGGEAAPRRADRKPRASGGRALTADSLINRNVKEANQERDGLKHIGGMKKGGRIHKTMGGLALPNWADSVSRATGGRTRKFYGGAMTPQQRMGLQQPAGVAPSRPGVRPMMRKEGGKVHADEAQDRDLIHKMDCKCGKCSGGRVGRAEGGRPERKAGGSINDGTRPVAGRLARKGGGRTKKGTNVNIIIAPQGGAQRPAMPPMGAAPPPGGPVGLHQGAPPSAPMGVAPGAPPGVMPPGAPPGVMPPGATAMMRASGGRANDGWSGKLAKPGKYPIDAGAGGGLGRLEKAARAGRQ